MTDLRSLFCFAGALIAASLLLVGCDSGGSSTTTQPADSLRSVSYPLMATSNSGTRLPDGVSGTVTFWEISSQTSVVTVALDGGATGTDVAHVAHIHDGTVAEGGGIAIRLSPIDGSGGPGTSARIVNQSFDDLSRFDGHVNVHESLADIETIIAQGNVGTNADGTASDGFAFVNRPRATEYRLTAQSNGGPFPTGVSGRILFQEISASRTLATVELQLSGATGASVSHPAHIHENSADEGGPIAYYLSPIDGSDPDTRSSQLLPEPIDSIAVFDGHVNIHQSIAVLDTLLSQGNIGANAN